VLVTNGVYGIGGTVVSNMPNRIALTKAVAVQSINGPEFTLIVGESPIGSNAVRCAYLSAGAELNGFTLTNGHTYASGDLDFEQSGGGILLNGGGMISNCIISSNLAYHVGGGAYCYQGGELNNCILNGNTANYGGGGVYCDQGGTLNNCVLSENIAVNYGSGGAVGGGGAYCDQGGTLNNCVLTSNLADPYGGGVACYGGGTLNHCTISSNSCWQGGGVHCYLGGTFNNCIVWGNSGSVGSNWLNVNVGMTYSYCCTTPAIGEKCVITDPLLIATNNFRLQPNSPCIDAGIATPGLLGDIEGSPRPFDGDNNGTTVPDIGAYEFINPVADSDGDGLSDGTELDTLGTNPLLTNTDGDAANDYEEYVADTDALNSNDVFRIIAIEGTTVWYQSSSNRTYTLLWSLDLESGYWGATRDQTRIMGSGGIDSLTDPYNDPTTFYRVEVEIP